MFEAKSSVKNISPFDDMLKSINNSTAEMPINMQIEFVAQMKAMLIERVNETMRSLQEQLEQAQKYGELVNKI